MCGLCTRYFGRLDVGARFRIKHLPGTTFMKIAPRESEGDRPNFPSMPFKGTYNSISSYGGRWVWSPDQVIEEVEAVHPVFDF